LAAFLTNVGGDVAKAAVETVNAPPTDANTPAKWYQRNQTPEQATAAKTQAATAASQEGQLGVERGQLLLNRAGQEEQSKQFQDHLAYLKEGLAHAKNVDEQKLWLEAIGKIGELNKTASDIQTAGVARGAAKVGAAKDIAETKRIETLTPYEAELLKAHTAYLAKQGFDPAMAIQMAQAAMAASRSK
jgi:hypothetical protein